MDGTTLVMLAVVLAAVVVGLVVWRRRGATARRTPGRDPADGPSRTDVAGLAGEPRPARMSERLARTRQALSGSISQLFARGSSDEAFDGLEEALIRADVGVEATELVVTRLREHAGRSGFDSSDAVTELLAEQLTELLGAGERTLGRCDDDGLTVWLVTGVNGTGKTTTIGKLAAAETRAGRTVVLAAADTFRAAAADQLGVWATRTGAKLVRGDEGADPASVAYQALDTAERDGADLLIVDTAGRLHNKQALMDELGKVRRVLEKRRGVHEALLVLDATTGQNGIVQARAFLEAVGVTGIALTKLDGTAKGGIVVSVQQELALPVKLVGLGEEVDDLAPFDPAAFVDGLLGRPNDA